MLKIATRNSSLSFCLNSLAFIDVPVVCVVVLMWKGWLININVALCVQRKVSECHGHTTLLHVLPSKHVPCVSQTHDLLLHFANFVPICIKHYMLLTQGFPWILDLKMEYIENNGSNHLFTTKNGHNLWFGMTKCHNLILQGNFYQAFIIE